MWFSMFLMAFISFFRKDLVMIVVFMLDHLRSSLIYPTQMQLQLLNIVFQFQSLNFIMSRFPSVLLNAVKYSCYWPTSFMMVSLHPSPMPLKSRTHLQLKFWQQLLEITHEHFKLQKRRKKSLYILEVLC